MTPTLTRRGLLKGLACSAAAHPLTSTLTLAETPGDNRLVVIVLRGAMDGLDAVRPIGDPAFAALRPEITAAATSHDLDGFFALHQGLEALLPLWKAGEFGVIHATSTPYRNKRSHFDGQDLLETGGTVAGDGARTGWLNRLLQELPQARAETALVVGDARLKLLHGEAPVTSWTPGTDLRGLSPATRALLDTVWAEDPLFAEAGRQIDDFLGSDDGAQGKGVVRLADFAGQRLRESARIAAFSVSGWDMHRGQHRAMTRQLAPLAEVLLTLKARLGPEWARTAVLCMTEFGRTARQNGSHGTDHGTGGAMLYAGGALKGGQVLGHWPGLAEADLFAGRDLMPTTDLRGWAAQVLAAQFGASRAALEGRVFPGLDLAAGFDGLV